MIRPTLAGFVGFIRNIMDIDVLYLPTDDPVIGYSLEMALDTVNRVLMVQPMVYTAAVYNLAGDLVLNFAQDQSGRDFFKKSRKNYGINDFAPGMIASTADSTTSTSLLNIEAMKNFTMDDLQRTKTPYGRTYLGYAQQYGSSIVGIS